MKKNRIGLKIFLLAVAEICLVLLILFLTMMIDQRICAALFSLCIVIAAFFATWCITKPATKKRVLISSGCLTAAAAVALCAVGGVILYDASLIINERAYYDENYRDENQPFTDGVYKLEGAEVMFSEKNAPVIAVNDASLYPLAASIINSFYSRTAFENCIDDYFISAFSPALVLEGNVDAVAVVYEEELDMFDGYEVTAIPIAADAIVIYSQSGTSVKSLTRDCLAGIFTGKITDWSQIGGEKHEIKAYAQNVFQTSGRMLAGYLDTQLSGYVTETYFVVNHFSFNQRPAAYRNVDGAVGFALMSQIDERFKNTAKIDVEGVSATFDTVADRSYPITSAVYAVTREDAGENARRLVELLTAESSARLYTANGFAAA